MPEKFGRFLYDYNIIRIALIIWVIVGFFNNWDYSDQWGCILQIEPVFRSLNIIFSFISLIIIASTFLFRDKKVKFILHSFETIYWIGKLLVLKGGYSEGIAGAPDRAIVLYDLVAILLRSLALRNLTFRTRTLNIILFTFLLMILKIAWFPGPITIYWKNDISVGFSKYTLKKIQGDWVGKTVFQLPINDTVRPKQVDSSKLNALGRLIMKNRKDRGDNIQIKCKWVNKYDSTTVKIHENIISIEIGKKVKKYLIVFKSEFYANLFVVLPDSINYDLEFMKKHKTNYRLNPEWKDNSSILFIKMGKDSLIFSEGRNKEYKLKKL